MKIITYNFRKGRDRQRLWALVIEAFAPDILLAQECCDPHERGLTQHSEGTTIWRRAANKYYWRTAVYTRTGKATALEFAEFSGWLVGVEVEGLQHPGLAGRRLQVVSLHAPPPKMTRQSYPKTVMKMLQAVEAIRGDADLIIGGDFNLSSLGQRDAAETKAGGAPWTTKPEEQAILTRLDERSGLINCWQTGNPNQPLAQTLGWSGNPEANFHCDGIFVPKSWGAAMQSCEVKDSDWETRSGGIGLLRSDHNPVLATFAEV